MSQFIEASIPCEHPPLFEPVNKRVLMPVLLDLNSHSIRVPNPVKSLFNQLKNEEFDRLRRQNAMEIRRQFQKLRQQMRRPNRENVESVFNSKRGNQKLNIAEIIQMKPEGINVLNRHKAIIANKLGVYRESQKISKDKEIYQQWHDRTHNQSLNSPSFNKMAYLLQRNQARDSTIKQLINRIPPAHQGYECIKRIKNERLSPLRLLDRSY